MTAQADYVRWWDGHKQWGGDHKSDQRFPEGTLIAGQGGIPTRKVLHRWRRLLDDAARATP
jgi:hypothetical protein